MGRGGLIIEASLSSGCVKYAYVCPKIAKVAGRNAPKSPYYAGISNLITKLCLAQQLLTNSIGTMLKSIQCVHQSKTGYDAVIIGREMVTNLG